MRSKKILLNIILILFFASPAIAVDSTSITINTYKITFTNLQISLDGGQTFTTVFSGSKEINPANVSSGLVDYLTQNYVIPPGTYNYLRINITGTGRAAFSAVFSGTTYYTNAATGLSTTGPAEEVDIIWSTTFYEGALSTPVEFAENYRRIVRISYYLIHPYAVVSTEDYSSWTLITTATVAFSDPEAFQAIVNKMTNVCSFTIIGTSTNRE